MSERKTVFAMFPGQGSQKIGMGKELYEETEIGKRLFNAADEVLGFSLSKICMEGPPEELTATRIAQPAILTVSTICYMLFLEETADRYEIKAAAGHSLGEYSALVAAGALRFEDAVSLVEKRGRYMQEAVPQGVGKMLAVLGKDLSEVEETLAKVESGVVGIANLNSPGQIVVSGDVEGIENFKVALGEGKIKELDVSAPFHCPLMEPAAERLAEDLAQINIQACTFPVYANYTAKPTSDSDELRNVMRQQVCGRVRWVDCVENALKDTQAELAIEFGAGKVLSGMLKRIKPETPRSNAGSLADLSTLA